VVVFLPLKIIEVVFHLEKELRLSSIFPQVEIRLHNKNQLPKLPGTAQIVITSMVVWWFYFTDNNTTPTKVVLSCFGLLVGLWQYVAAGGIIKKVLNFLP
jgi:hypothetical protein